LKYILFFILFLNSVVAVTDEPKWVDWSDANFAKAKTENRLVILDLQAVWCHWCHVMEEKTYQDSKVNAILGAHFIAVRVDQDSRPDISNRWGDYGWPATIIMNGDGKELAKRSGYIEPDKMLELLNQVVAHPDQSLDDEEKASGEVAGVGYLSRSLEKNLTQMIASKYDRKLGGWDISHKFMDVGLMEYFITESKIHKKESKWRRQAKQTLDAQLVLIDPVWGGVYQYSAGGDWDEPHFEKIMSVQTDNLRIYSASYTLFHDEKYLKAAKSIYGFLKNFLSSNDGVFYTSQDADLVQGEHGGEYFKLNDAGRRKQGVPRIDKNIYARENGWAIQGLLSLYAATGDKVYLDDAVKAAQWIVKNRSFTYEGKAGGYHHGDHDDAGPYLGDTLSMGAAFMLLYAATGERAWLEKSQNAAKFIEGVFSNKKGDQVTGYLSSISPSKILKGTVEVDENVQSGRYLNLLYYYTGVKNYLEMSKNAMTYLSIPRIARNIYVAPSILLLQRELNVQPLHVTVVGHKDEPESLSLMKAGLSYPNFYKRVDWWDKREGPLVNSDVSYPELKKPAAFACANQSCGLPATTPEELLKQIGKVE
jgi:uncharacterized protein YyaL (SSP411 family)